MRRAQTAQGSGLNDDEIQAFAKPFPGSSNINVTKTSGGLPVVAGLSLAAVGATALAWAVPLMHAQPAATSVATTPAQVQVSAQPIAPPIAPPAGPADATTFDPNQYQFRVVPDTGE